MIFRALRLGASPTKGPGACQCLCRHGPKAPAVCTVRLRALYRADKPRALEECWYMAGYVNLQNDPTLAAILAIPPRMS